MMTSEKQHSKLWAITAVFNPSGYRRRISNYHLFRHSLQVPLVTVELSNSLHFELAPGDADILIQLHTGSVLWQKERLLNVALSHVPAHVEAVAWLDCDIILQPDTWVEDTLSVLKEKPIAQVFSRLFDLARDVMPGDVAAHPDTVTSRSLAYKVATGTSSIEDFRPTTSKRRGMGFGWAAQKRLLDRHGLYDAFILGSGDRAIACAAYGKFEDAIAQVQLNDAQTVHYLSWARPFYEDVRGEVGFIDATAFHLWHGNPENRRYRQRHVDFRQFEFNPFTDMSINGDGCWALASGKDALQLYVEEYFAARREDDDVAATVAVARSC